MNYEYDGLGCGGCTGAGLLPAVPHCSVDPGDVLHHEPAGGNVCICMVPCVVIVRFLNFEINKDP